ncbi:hypothetical protein J4734_02340 [Klebsiella pneumoniae]|uniref:Uncharacterized protein n=1 Tax=Klebsiella pneumoniae TaxID=573 RepID=A0A939SVF8_KLEPN|nr:hypothetical protein [Klebsiella pneumoniae]
MSALRVGQIRRGGFERCSNGPEGGGQDARHKLPGIKQVKSPSCRMGFLRFCRPASVPVCLPVALRLPGLRIRHGATSLWPDKVQHRLRKIPPITVDK